MAEVVIVDNEFITVRYLDDKRIIYHTVHKPIAGQPLRDALVAGTEAMKTYGACKWLSDDRLNGPLTQEDIEWGFNNWNLPTIKAGWKFWALVVPTELIAAGSLTFTINSLYDLGLRVMAFDNLEEAMAWLDKMPG
jgi:hypothetical protein